MLIAKHGWVDIAEVNPPSFPDDSHLSLEGVWSHVLITDNVFGKIRVSPYAYAARLAHDAPSVHPTVVVSTRDRNILAIESEVRGAVGNGVDSFLVVIGDTVLAIEHFANHYEIVGHMRELQEHLPPSEVGMPTRFRECQFRQRVECGAQFFVVGPVVDPETVESQVGRLRLRAGDPPVFLMAIPPFSPEWVERVVAFGCIEPGADLKERLASLDPAEQRAFGWDQLEAVARRVGDAGCAGLVIMGLKQETVAGEASAEWRRRFPGRAAGSV